jgi:pyruvate/2-oxoglutarate/acetoin dehydrogenase E1 component
MRVDFMILAMNQITNIIASFSYGAGGLKVPIVIRAIIGRGWGQSWQHSKTLHSWFAHVPGLKVVMPARARDARDMMIAAIRDDNPVICIEHRWLYDVTGEVPDEIDPDALVGCRVVRDGTDVTVVAVSWMVIEALKAAEVLAERGVDVEVIDVRSIAPYDSATVADSVRKTGHAVVADYDWIHCGFGAEVAARIYEECMAGLENAYYPNAIDIIRAIERKLDLSEADLTGEEFYSYEKKFKGPF